MRRHAAIEEGPVVRHHQHRAGEAVDERLEQVDARRSRGCWWARRAAARRPATAGWRPARPGPPRRPKRGDLLDEAAPVADLQARPWPAPPRPGTRGRRRRAPGTGRARRSRRRPTRARPTAPRCAVELVGGLGHAGAPGQVAEQRLAGPGVGLLREVADGQRRRRPLDPPVVGPLEPGRGSAARWTCRPRSARPRRRGRARRSRSTPRRAPSGPRTNDALPGPAT